jgi:glycosyltransferase involved in cell wall biosynthesis
MEQEVHLFSQKHQSIHVMPYLSQKECFDLIKGARFLVWPSGVETFGLVAIESFACGTPVIASRSNAMEIVEDKKTGLHFASDDFEDLAAKVEWAWTHPREMAAMGRAARAEYEANYTAKRNYHLLMDIYSKARTTAQEGA